MSFKPIIKTSDQRPQKKFFGLKRLFKLKFMKGDKGVNLNENDKDNDYDYYVCDALPSDDRKVEEQTSVSSGHYTPESDTNDDIKVTSETEDKVPTYKKEKFHPSKHEEKRPSSPKDDGGRYEEKSSSNKGFNMFVGGSGNIGILMGNVTNTIHTLQCNGSPIRQQTKKIEETKAIRDLLSCEDEIEGAHLDILSKHFGNHWRSIGLAMGLGASQLDHIECDCKGLQNSLQRMGFKTLDTWTSQQGDGATVGYLCSVLWAANIKSAWKAVEQLSLVIEDMKS